MDGDDELLATFRATLGELYAFVARRVGGERAVAEDVVQETWLRAVATWRRSGAPREPIAWLKTTARRLVANHFRARRARPSVSLEEADGSAAAAIDHAPESRDAATLLQRGLARLREEAARAEVTRLQPLVEKNLVSPAEFYEKEVRRIALAQEASVLGLDAIEVGYTGREPDRRLCAPLVDGRDLIRERLDQEIGALKFRVSGSEQRAKMIEQLVERHFESAVAAVDARRFATRMQREFDLVGRRIELRGRFLRGELDAVAVELLSLESEALMHVANAGEELAAEEHASARDIQMIEKLGYTADEERYSLATRRAELHLAELELATIRARIVAAGCDDSSSPPPSSQR